MDSHTFLPFVVLPLFILAVAGLLRRFKATSRLPYPPGPKPRFTTGNLHDVPTELPWLTYTEWGRRYGGRKKFILWLTTETVSPGDVVHAQVFGNHILIVNWLKAAIELFERRASIYSDRPTIPMLPL